MKVSCFKSIPLLFLFTFSLAALCCDARSKDWRTLFIDSDVSVEAPWFMDHSDTLGVRSDRKSYGSSLLLITRTDVHEKAPADADELEQRYAAVLSAYVLELKGQPGDSSTFADHGVIGKKLTVAYRDHDSDFVAEAVFILSRKYLYCVQYRHAVDALPVEEAVHAMSTVAVTKIFEPGQQFEKKVHTNVFEQYFRYGFSFGLVLGICVIGYFVMRWIRQNKTL